MSKQLECGICGKKFYKVYCSIYSVQFGGKSYNCCSYTCYQAAKKVKESHNSSAYERLRREISYNPKE